MSVREKRNDRSALQEQGVKAEYVDISLPRGPPKHRGSGRHTARSSARIWLSVPVDVLRNLKA